MEIDCRYRLCLQDLSDNSPLPNLVKEGRLICNSQPHWCDHKTPVYFPPTAPPVDISCTYPECPDENGNIKNFELRFQEP